VIASPFYDYISVRYQRIYHPSVRIEESGSFWSRLLRTIKEELKKALLVLALPLVLLLIPAVGTVLALLAAGICIAWDYLDFSIAREHVLLKERLRVLWRHKFEALGFGLPLLVPFVGLLLLPFAVLGATRLYFDRMRDRRSLESSS
jgi:CysZ protein